MLRSASRGLTLIEVLIALAIIGVTFGVLAVTQVSNLQISSAARAESRAAAEANTVLETVVACIVRSHVAFESALAGTGCDQPLGTGFEGSVDYGSAVTSLVDDSGDPVDYDDPGGNVRVTVRITEPSSVVFSRLVSCIDVQPPPAIARPGPCPERPGD